MAEKLSSSSDEEQATEMAVSKAGHRNIIVLGKTGCGKSSLANKIIGCVDEKKLKFDVQRSLQSVTTKVKMVKEKVKIFDKSYIIQMIDTIGFRDPREKGKMSDGKIIEEIKRQMKERAPEGFSLLIFVFKSGRFTEEEKKVFKIISDNFTDLISELSMLVITNCDTLTDAARIETVEKFRTDPLTKDFAEMMTKGIYTVGLPKITEVRESHKNATLKEMAEDMKPIYKVIAEADDLHLQSDLHNDSFWRHCKNVCPLM